ncbi:MAG TPA: insulinase family protein [Tenuifilaceae bacterium]|nr:insulinase family protein [Tenuifilaceae bacterium]HPI44054.1 insulinase family protein [Tenuifilaceae bacterium]
MKNFLFGVTLFLIPTLLFAQEYKYESIPGDPLNARIYTLSNGLKVYMSVVKDEPRIQTFIPVRVGSKNDPKETTGLAHYFEHMMFKGTPEFGTMDWEKEKVLIDKIESLFEVYRVETDPDKRAAIYHVIDSISFEASKLAIPNEYDKLMASIGSTGTNAGTSNDYTVYIENIPNNQLENWALIQSKRFSQNVLRLFHTELETVYEEKNMSLTNDGRKASELMMKGLYPNHPYGQQTTLGEAEHLKNPSMKNIREFFAQYYVPNNFAVVLAGDFNPDEAIKIVDKYFGGLKPVELPEFKFKPEEPITTPVVLETTGLEAENISIGFRFNGANSADKDMLDLISSILFNRKAGLVDLNINKKQVTLGCSAFGRSMVDYSMLQLSGRNKKGQSLDEVKDLLLQQVELLKKGDFPDWMLEAAINNQKLSMMNMLESGRGRASMMYMAYLNRINWADAVSSISRLEKITKDQIVKFANEKLGNNYVVVYKRQGKPEDVAKVAKPAITPVHINRDVESDFLKKIKSSTVKSIEPVFVDYKKDITKFNLNKDVEVLYNKNIENGVFRMVYHFPFGRLSDPALAHAADYIQLLGTSKLTADQVSQEFYKLACTFNVSVSDEEIQINLYGLSENSEKAMSLMESLLNDSKPDAEALKSYVANQLKARNDSKKNQSTVFRALVSYATYGAENPFNYILSEEQLKALTPEVLIQKVKALSTYPHTVLYYGTANQSDLKKMLTNYHKLPKKFNATPLNKKFVELDTPKDRVVFTHYEAKQSYLQTISKSVPYSFELYPIVSVYNDYFGGGMNAIVFQELREKRGLAYTARARFNTPSKPDRVFVNTSYIATQNDKIVDAFNAFNELFNDMPEVELGFNLSKESAISDIRTNRTEKMDLLWSYVSAKEMGWNTDIRKVMFEKIPTFTLSDVKKFQEQYVKGKSKTYVILGKEADMDFGKLEQLYGPVTKLTLEDIFGY